MNVNVLEMPLDFGGNRHGSDMGPSAIRLAGLKQAILDLGYNSVEFSQPISVSKQEAENAGNAKARYLNQIVDSCEKLALQVEDTVRKGDFPIILGGDHSIALGTFAGLSAAYKFTDLSHKKIERKSPRIGVLYVDAHGDFNTCETSPSGNIHGMCMAASCGYGIDELTNLYYPGCKINSQNICYVGLRDLDSKEKLLMKEAGVTAFTMSDIDRQGFSKILNQVVVFFKTHADIVHVSFDMDVIDPMFAPGVGIPVPGGLNYREALLLMEEMAETGLVKSAEIVEVNPVLDVRNQTAAMAVELLSRLLGKKIWL